MITIRSCVVLVAYWGLLHMAPAGATTGVASLADFCSAGASTHTACIQKWLDTAAKLGGELYVPPGEWRYDAPVYVWPNTQIRCAGPGAATFKRLGKASSFLTPHPKRNFFHNFTIADCAFDVNGGTANFLSVISVNLGTSKAVMPVRNIHVRGNRIYDSVPYTKPTPDNQRQFVVLLPCVDCWVEGNRLSEGGRIKVGRPGERLFIRNNYLEAVNDNAITVADSANGATANVVIDGNVIVSPVGAGIFFGSDGQEATGAATSTVNVQVSGNIVRGNWATACIQATLPPTAARVHIVHNICHKTGATTGMPGGIGVTRADIATVHARDLLVGFNTVAADPGSSLDGGIALSGFHEGVRIVGNQVRGVAVAIRLRNRDAKDFRAALIADNTMADGGLEIYGGFSGDIRGNAVVAAGAAGFNFMSEGLPVRGTVAGNSISIAKVCMQFDGKPLLELHVIDNTFHQCGGLSFYRDLAPGYARLHNQGDVAPNLAPTRHLASSRPWSTTVPAGDTVSFDVPLSGATPGDIASAAFTAIVSDALQLKAYVQVNNYVRVLVTNPTAAAVPLDGTVRVHVWKF